MDESLLQATLGRRVGLGGQPNEAFREHVCLQRFEAGDHHVDPHVVLVASEQMRLGQVLLHQVAGSFVDRLLLANDADASSAGAARRFQNVHIFEVAHLSVVIPPLEIFREKIRRRADLEVLPVTAALSLDISPEVTLVSNVPSTSEVIQLLELIQIFELRRPDEASPQAVPLAAVAEAETCRLEGVDHTVVGMGRVIDLEAQS
mmetsp:Transcript_13126/g.20386  ORF Transcript_13126/g.20386 Transcript_13126/m.20386 type:complete len:204 (+) Transcript_13126:1015-1626(+)